MASKSVLNIPKNILSGESLNMQKQLNLRWSNASIETLPLSWESNSDYSKNYREINMRWMQIHFNWTG